ncbi:IclR family transcriptional regulator [Actinopolymorpha pittospori]|uniref:Glycerol operon regulatory protein n=1 Tax=Actinopolymorpha pittospori TaxID=648752 RepID=A0A927N1V5_9ACTN|nr:IclR family transcriptional regulator [Actinopolymorpha pittospori]MBE1610237.1 DNA-binding IclR family transcriptional regulator [Actinopolymorpha pittospori]
MSVPTEAEAPSGGQPSPRQATTYEVGPLDRALDVLEKLAEATDMSLVELSAAVGLSKATVFRHLKVLARRGYVTQDPNTKRYSLGYRLLDLGFHARTNLQLPRVAHDAMAILSTSFNETVHLGVVMDNEVVHIAVIPSTHPLKMASEVGERTLVHVSALGKCLIAWEGPDALEALLAGPGLPAVSERTITTPAAFEAELARVRAQGFALDDQESLEGLRCVGAPVRAAGGAVVGAISLSGPVDRVSEARLPEITEAVRHAADQISRLCGWKR